MTTCACSNCQFFDVQSDAKVSRLDQGSGLCRFNPPIPQQASNERGVWPVVGKGDWCGHFAATVERFMAATG